MKTYRNFDIWLERACHLTVVALSVAAAFLLRFDFTLPAGAIPILKQALLIAILVKLPIFDLIGFYRSLRRFVSIPDLYLVFLGNVAGSVLFIAVSMLWIGPSMPRSAMGTTRCSWLSASARRDALSALTSSHPPSPRRPDGFVMPDSRKESSRFFAGTRR